MELALGGQNAGKGAVILWCLAKRGEWRAKQQMARWYSELSPVWATQGLAPR